MQATLVTTSTPPMRHGLAPLGGGPGPCAHARAPAFDADATFVAMLGAYRCSGGLARVDEVVTLLEGAGHPAVATLARWIVDCSVIGFEWEAQTWLPWFQFGAADHVPGPALRAVIAELHSAYDGWELAHWFARPNSALAGCAPVDRIVHDADAVLQAARADRFIAKG
jgi:hypothetical protein